MNDFIDIYCERLSPELWAEPLNAITNISFFIAAFFAWKFAKKKMDFGAALLIVLMVCIGVGSSLFHTFATHATQLMDVIPILLFQIAFIWLYSMRVMKLNAAKTAGLFLLFLIMSAVFDRMPAHWMNGSLSYIPAMLFVSGFALWHYKNAAQEKMVLSLAAGTFIISLTFRSIDMAVCDSLQIGTHFLWHSLNGLVLYLSARGYIVSRKN